MARKPTRQSRCDDPNKPDTGEGKSGPKAFTQYAARQLTQGVAPNEGGVNPTHLYFADAEFRHHKLARNVNVLPHQIREETEQKEDAK